MNKSLMRYKQSKCLGSFHYWLSDLYHVPKHLLCLYLMRLLFIDPFIVISRVVCVI